jgi:hypothetical protein
VPAVDVVDDGIGTPPNREAMNLSTALGRFSDFLDGSSDD